MEGENTADEYSEEEEVDWSGKVIDKEESKEAGISNDAFTCWNGLVAIDEAGLKTLKFKRPYKQSLAKMQAFSEVSFLNLTAIRVYHSLPYGIYIFLGRIRNLRTGT